MPSESDVIAAKFPKVPVIGLQPTKVNICGTVVSMVVLCDCGSPVPVLIPNMDRAGMCLTCKTKYVIAKVNYSNDGKQVLIEHVVAKWGGPMRAMPDLDVKL